MNKNFKKIDEVGEYIFKSHAHIIDIFLNEKEQLADKFFLVFKELINVFEYGYRKGKDG